ncbi:MAG TPA: FtsX-like permease family protein, partial [Gemmatimonadales bacterium]|nr:FtsX-like permease family protein [Gemmatimonadales bacterium]
DFVGTPRAIVINQSFAARHYPGEDPVGQRLMIGERGYTDVEIVGVVADVRERGPMFAAPAMLYAPFQAAPRGNVALFARVRGAPGEYTAAVRQAIWEIDARQPVMDVTPFEALARQAMAIPRMIVGIVSPLALATVALAALGVFGVVAFAIRARRHELGVRLALGATTDRLERDLVLELVPVVAVALTLAVGAVVALARPAASILYGVTARDPVMVTAAAALVGLVAAASAWIPARSVARIDPARVMRDG